MAKMTLLTMVQKILSSMDSDDVNSVSDTEEAVQITDVIEDTYFHLMSQKDWAHLKATCTLESLSDLTRPTYLKIPDTVGLIEDLRYDITKSTDTNKKIALIRYCEPIAFLDLMLNRNTSDANVDSLLTDTGTPLFIYNDRAPTLWTSFDDENVILDSYDVAEEATLSGSKAYVFCIRSPVFDKFTDTFVPDLPEELFPVFLAECKRASHLYHKQSESAVDAKRAIQGIHRARNHGWRANDGRKKARFGR